MPDGQPLNLGRIKDFSLAVLTFCDSGNPARVEMAPMRVGLCYLGYRGAVA